LTIRNEDIGDEFCEFGIASGGNFKFYFKKYATSLNFGTAITLIECLLNHSAITLLKINSL